MDVGKRVRELREDRGLSQEELAELTGVGRNTISEIERGVTSPQLRIVRKLAHGFAVPLHELIREDTAEPSGAAAP